MFFTGLLLLAALPAFAADVEVTGNDSGKTVSLQRGDSLVVSLRSNQGTGFRWTVLHTDPSILAPDSTHRSGRPMPGGPSTTTLVFDALRNGSTTLVLQYARRNNNHTSEVGRTVSFTVKVGRSEHDLALGVRDNGGYSRVRVGETITITVPSNRTTGYDWKLKPTSNSILRAKGDHYLPSSDTRPGVGGEHVFKFVVARRGTSEVQLGYLRSWEHGVRPAKTWSYTFTAR
ncbi:hypothetical protein BH11ARM2_BH11ARM2_11970 [soil metagenome]